MNDNSWHDERRDLHMTELQETGQTVVPFVGLHIDVVKALGLCHQMAQDLGIKEYTLTEDSISMLGMFTITIDCINQESVI